VVIVRGAYRAPALKGMTSFRYIGRSAERPGGYLSFRSTPHAPFSLQEGSDVGNAEKKGEGPVEPNGPGRPVKGTQAGLFGEEGHTPEAKKLIKGQYPFGEVASAMQKELRRGALREALWWGLLLYEAAPYYCWKRLLVCVVEDVGAASPETVDRVVNLAIAWRIAKEKSWFVTPHALTMAIMLICAAPKSTAVEDLQTITLTKIKELAALKSKAEWPPIPDYGKDAHTDAGKAAGKTWKDWYRDRHGVCGVPINVYTEELWAMRPDWDPRGP
jgi:MgsA AAA+ ATPase C terminal